MASALGRMKIFAILSIAISTPIFSMSVYVPSFLDMWDSAQVVIVCNLPEIEKEEPHTEIDNQHPKLDYFTARITLNIDGERMSYLDAVIKGELTHDEKEYLQEEPQFFIQTVSAEERKVAREVPEGHLFLFGTAGYLRQPPPGANRCLLFMKRDLGGGLKPINDQYFIYYLTRSVEYRPIK